MFWPVKYDFIEFVTFSSCKERSSIRGDACTMYNKQLELTNSWIGVGVGDGESGDGR